MIFYHLPIYSVSHFILIKLKFEQFILHFLVPVFFAGGRRFTSKNIFREKSLSWNMKSPAIFRSISTIQVWVFKHYYVNSKRLAISRSWFAEINNFRIALLEHLVLFHFYGQKILGIWNQGEVELQRSYRNGSNRNSSNDSSSSSRATES